MPKKSFKILMLFSVLASCCRGADAQLAQDPQRDLSVTFGSTRLKPEDPGFIIGLVRNNSTNAYSCVRLEFGLVTAVTSGEKIRSIGVVSTIVRSINPRSGREYRYPLPFPVSFGMNSISLCKQEEPVVNLYTVRPDSVRKGEAVIITWKTVSAERVFLGEANPGFPHSSSEPVANGIEMPLSGSRQLTALRTTTYMLQAMSRGQSTTKALTLNVTDPRLSGTCSIAGRVTGRLSEEEPETDGRGKPTGRHRTRSVSHIGLFTTEGKLVLTTPINSRNYIFSNVEAGKRYSVVPGRNWSFAPRDSSVVCEPQGFHTMNIDIKGLILFREG